MARSRNHFYHRKAISITYYKRMFVALLIRHAVRMRRIILSVACMAIQYVFITLRRSSPKYSKMYSYCQSEPRKIRHYMPKM